MSLIKDLNYNEFKIECQNTIKKELNYPKVIEKTNEIYGKVQNILSSSKNEKTTRKKLNDLKNVYKENMYKDMVDVISRHFEEYNPCNKLDLRNDSGLKNGYYLGGVTEGYITPPNPNQHKIFMLRATSPNNILPIDYIALHPEAYNKFAKFMSENPDVTDWFSDFVYKVNNHINDNEIKLKQYILMLYENQSKENRVRFLDEVGKKDEGYIINIIKIVPEIWIHFFKIVEEYARKKVKGSKEKWYEYASRDILDNTVGSKNVNDMVRRAHTKEREEKERRATESRQIKF